LDLPTLARDIDKLASADAVVADSYIRYALRKSALYFLACILVVMGLTLLALSLYWLLEQSLGAIAAAALVGIIGCMLAGIIAAIAMLQRPGREFDLAMTMRKSAVTTLEQSIATSPANVAAFVYPATEALITSLILPLIGALLRSLKASRSKPADQPAEILGASEPLPATPPQT
jgi:hypothetical protein